MATATKVYSSGQTDEDIAGLAHISALAYDDDDPAVTMPPPPALTDPNYIPPDRGPSILALCVVTLLIATTLFIMRLIVKVKAFRRLQLEDYFLSFGYVS